MEQRSTEEPNTTESRESRQPAIRSSPKAGTLTEARYRERIRRRVFRTLDYTLIAISVLLIYGAILICDYFLIDLIEYLFHAEMKDLNYLAVTSKGIKIGLALLTFVLATVHGVRSAIEQYQLDAKLARENEKPHV